MSIYLHLPIMIVVVSLVYSATRYEEFRHIRREALRWGYRMVSFLVSIGLVLFILSSLI